MKLFLIVIACVLVIAAIAVLLYRRGSSDEQDLRQADHPKSVLDHPRYRENPTNLFFEDYILDVIGHLPAEGSKAIQEMNLQGIFNTKAHDWRGALKEALGLSDTIDIAILDLWYRNREIGRKEGMEYEPRQFAVDFVDHFFEEDSSVDKWGPGALEAAKERIKRYQEEE